jgi:hypothetical protein
MEAIRVTRLEYLLVTALFCFPGWANGEEAEFVKKLKCQPSKCKVKCLHDNGEWVVVGQAEAVTVNILRNGVTYFQLDIGAKGQETIIVGRDQLYCKVENQE